MAQNVATVGVGVQYDLAGARLQQQLNAEFRRINIPSLRLNARQFTEPLGQISRSSKDFQRSLDASNARVIAFGASAGIIYGIGRAFTALVKTTVEVEKAFADINVIFGLSNKQLKSFQDNLFQVANQTSQSFATVSKAALELSRQGLSVSETLKRTRDALALTRLSGLDAVASVESITAALNSFNDVTLDSTRLVSKLAAVDAQYAVSSRDLAEAFQRVGSTANDAGVNIDSLIALVTSAQQITSRGGAVIGNSLKTIFQRLQRPEVLESLQLLNVQVRDLQGNVLAADRILLNLASTYSTLSKEQQNQVTQLAAGVFQANQFKALLSDLGKQNSIFSGAQLISKGATDEAIQRITELRKTTAALFQETVNNLQNAGSKIGSFTVEPAIRNLLTITNKLLDEFGGINASPIGRTIGEGLLKGLGEYLSGPGLLAAGALIVKLLRGFGAFSRDAFTNIIESQSRRVRIEQELQTVIARQPGLLEAINRGALTQEQIQQRILLTLREQLLTQSGLAKATAAAQAGIASGSIGFSQGRGFSIGRRIPNFASNSSLLPLSSAISREVKSGINPSQIRIGRSSLLQSLLNPSGLGVYNTRDEPGGLSQGINRYKSAGLNPKTAGIPNFADYYQNIQSSFNDPFGRKPGTGLLNPQLTASLEEAIEQVKSEAKIGLHSQKTLSEAAESLGKSYTLTDKTVKQINSRFQKSLNYFNTSTQKKRGTDFIGYTQGEQGQLQFGPGGNLSLFSPLEQARILAQKNPQQYQLPLGPDTGQFRYLQAISTIKVQEKQNKFFQDQSLQRLRASISPTKGDYNELTGLQSKQLQRAIAANRSRLENIIPISPNARPQMLGPDASRFRYLKAIEEITRQGEQNRGFITSEEFGPTRETFSAGRAQSAYSRLSGSNLRGFGIGRGASADIRALKENNPALYQQFNNERQNKALIGSFLLPIIGSTLQSAIGDQTRGQRGVGQSLSSLTNIGSYAATGFAIGGPKGGALGAVLGLATELPRAINAFKDTLPELTKEIDRLKERTQQTSESFGGIITVSEKLFRIQTGQAGSITRNEFQSLVNEQRRLLLSSPNPRAGRQIIEKIREGDIAGAQQLGAAFAGGEVNLLSQTQFAAALEETLKSGKFNLGANTRNTPAILPPTTPFGLPQTSGSRENILRLNSLRGNIERQAELEKYRGAFQSLVLPAPSRTEIGKQLVDIIGRDINKYAENLKGINNQGNITDIKEFTDSFRSFAASNGVVLSKELFDSVSKIEGGALLDALSPQNIEKFIRGFDEVGQAAIKNSLEFSKLNDILFDAQTKAIKLGQSLENNFIDRLEKINLGFGRIGQNIGFQRQRNEFRQNPYLSNLFTFRQEDTENQKNLLSSLEESTNQAQQEVRQVYQQNVLGKIEAEAKRITESGFFKGAESNLEKLIQNSIKDLDDAFSAGFERYSNESIQTIIDNFRKLNSKTQTLSKLGGLTQSLQQLIQSADQSGNINLRNLENQSSLARYLSLGPYEGANDLIRGNVQAERAVYGALTPQNGIITKNQAEKLLDELNRASILQSNSLDALSKLQEIQLNQQTRERRVRSAFDVNKVLGLEKFKGQESFLTDEFKRELGNINLQSQIDQFFGGQQLNRNLGLSRGLFGLQRQGRIANPFSRLNLELQQEELKARTGKDYNIDRFLQQELGGLTSRGILGRNNRAITTETELRTKGEELQKEFQILGSIESKTNEQEKLFNQIRGELEDIQKSEARIAEEKRKQNQEYDEILQSQRELLKQKQEELRLELGIASNRASAIGDLNERLAKEGNFGEMNFKDSFLSEWEYGTKDFYKDLARNNQEFARDFKSSVKEGFSEFANGTKSAEDALRSMAINIATNLFNRVNDIGINSLFGGISKLLGANSAGALGFANGGYVSGGSGMRDDIPAFLEKGGFVMRRSAVNRYGSGFFNAINNRSIPKMASGGIFNPFNSKKQLKKGIKVGRFLPSDSTARLASPISGADIRLENQFEYLGIDPTRPTGGRNVFSSNLSQFGRSDEDSAQNAIRLGREATQFSYSQNYKSYIDQQKAAYRQYQDAKNQRLISAAISAFFTIGGAGLRSIGPSASPQSGITAGSGSGRYDLGTSGIYNNNRITPSFYGAGRGSISSFYHSRGGLIPRFAFGGSVGPDRVPAMLMGGEYVLNKNAVDYYGPSFLNKINNGLVNPRGYAAGGLVGRDSAGFNNDIISSVAEYERKISETLVKLTTLFDSFSKNIPDKNGNIRGEQNNKNYAPQITFNQNITIESNGNVRGNTQTNSTSNNQEDLDNAKRLGENLKAMVIKTISEQLRPGGIIKESRR